MSEPVADMRLCGAGTERCCIFLAAGPDGAVCLRPTALRPMLEERHAKGEMNARRNPVGPFPDCQQEERYD